MGEEEVGEGSVDRRMVSGFLRNSNSGGFTVTDGWTRSVGRGDGRNSSILSVSGTGSIMKGVVLLLLSGARLKMVNKRNAWNRNCDSVFLIFVAVVELCRPGPGVQPLHHRKRMQMVGCLNA